MACNCSCRLQRKEEQEETPGDRRGTMNNMTTQEELGDDPASIKVEIQQLRKKLQEAELAEAVRNASHAGILNVVTQTGSTGKSQLGSTVFFPVKVNGVRTNALVDT